MYVGVIVWFNDAKGYGSIKEEGRDQFIFIHYSQIQSKDKRKSLNTGDKVTFDLYESRKGFLEAKNLYKT